MQVSTLVSLVSILPILLLSGMITVSRLKVIARDIKRRRQPQAEINGEDSSSVDAPTKHRRKSVPAAAAASLPPLFSIGALIPFTVLSRPSIKIKSPYVADVMKKDAFPFSNVLLYDSSTVTAKNKSKDDKALIEHFILNLKADALLAHAPSLDCAGTVVPGSTVYCSTSNKETKTSHTIQLCEEIRGGASGHEVALIGYHPNIAERAAKAMFEKKMLADVVGDYSRFETQKTFGDSRVDYVLYNDETKLLTLVEIKNVVGADYIENEVPSQRSMVGVYQRARDSAGVAEPRHAIFPHGSHKAGVGVVSDRAIKHVHELTLLHNSIDKNSGYKVASVVLFIINRCDCQYFRPCHEADMLFAQLLKHSASRGVQVVAQQIGIDKDSGDVHLRPRLPVIYDKTVDESEIDEAFLHRVLAFNKENGSPKKEKSKPKK